MHGHNLLRCPFCRSDHQNILDIRYAFRAGDGAQEWMADMKLVAAVVQEYDRANLVKAIVDAGYRATVISSKGGFLRTGNATILSAVESQEVARLLEIIAEQCSERVQIIRPDVIGDYADWYPPHEVEVLVGGATVFVLPVVHFERIL